MRPVLQAPSPNEIAAALGKRVIGQAGAVQEMAIALSKKLAGLGVGNILMIGSSGTGKLTGAFFQSRDREELLTRSDKPLPAPRKEMALKGADLQKYVGEYELAPGFTLTFRAEGDRFFGRATGQEEFEVFGDGPHSFFLKVVDASMVFHMEADGSVQRMTFDQGGPTEAKRVK